jgi:hypothetical protein
MSSRLDDLILDAIHSWRGSSPVDIPTILERIDSMERWVLTFDELDGGLRRLSEAGRIGEIAAGRYVVTGSQRSARPYSGISRVEFDAAVAAYRTPFAADVVWLMRSPLLRAPVAFYRWCYRLTGGRFGLPPGMIDLDAVAIAFAVERVIAPFGAVTGDLSVEGDSLIVPVLESDTRLDRTAVADGLAAALRQRGLRRVVVLHFSDADKVVGND